MTKDQISGAQPFQIGVPVADLRDRPNGSRIRQLLFGATVMALGQREGYYFVEANQDGYKGFIDPADLARAQVATHKVSTLATHVYTAPDIKSPELCSLSFGSRVAIAESSGTFSQTEDGHFIPSRHIVKSHLKFRDPVGVADLFLGTPYLWGGNSRLGIDCSGLVQIACQACGLPCPGDSQEQAASLGEVLADDDNLKRGDLLFWKGHVAFVASSDRLLHANAYHMTVAYESLDEAIARIGEQDGGEIIQRRRL